MYPGISSHSWVTGSHTHVAQGCLAYTAERKHISRQRQLAAQLGVPNGAFPFLLSWECSVSPQIGYKFFALFSASRTVRVLQ